MPNANLTLQPDPRMLSLISKPFTEDKLNAYFKESEKAKRFEESKIIKSKLDALKLSELKRQKFNLRSCQEKELQQIESSQKV